MGLMDALTVVVRSAGSRPLCAEGREGFVEPLIEGIHAAEDGRQKKVQQSPQLGKVILQRRS